MNILVAGASGFIGSALCKHVKSLGHTVFTLGRASTHDFQWQPRSGQMQWDKSIALDAVVNLAGENIASRWTTKKKDEILQSRVKATEMLSQALSDMTTPPKVFISGSAMGFYGDSRYGDTRYCDKGLAVNEDAAPGEGFLAEVAVRWEQATQVARDAGIPTIYLRTGLVLDPSGGALAKMLLPFKLGLGGKMGDGQHYMSWISLADAVRVIAFLAESSLTGPVNMVSPVAVTNAEFTRALGQALQRPTPFPMPRWIAEVIFGEMAKEALLASIRVTPTVLVNAGFQFQDVDLQKFLQHRLA